MCICTVDAAPQLYGSLSLNPEAYLAANPEVKPAGVGHEHPEKK